MDTFFATIFLILAGLAVVVVGMLVVAVWLNALAGLLACLIYPLRFLPGMRRR